MRLDAEHMPEIIKKVREVGLEKEADDLEGIYIRLRQRERFLEKISTAFREYDILIL